MTVIGWMQIVLYCAIIVAITPVLGAYMTRVFNGERTFLSPILRPVELALYRTAGVDEKREQQLAHLHSRHVAVSYRRISYPLCVDAFPGAVAIQSGRAIGCRA